MRERRVIRGYTDLGTNRVPALPQNIIMTDRDNGTLWFLTYSLTPETGDGLGRIMITDVLPSQDRTIYGPYDGPYVSLHSERIRPVIRLFVRGGFLGYEVVDGQPEVTAQSNQRVVPRVGMDRSLREIVIPSDWETSSQTFGNVDTLAWRDLTV